MESIYGVPVERSKYVQRDRQASLASMDMLMGEGRGEKEIGG